LQATTLYLSITTFKMVRRSSARIRERSGTTPTRDIPSDHIIAHASDQTPTKLTTLTEDDEDIAMPGSFPTSTSPSAIVETRAVTPVKQTPVKQTPIKPSDAEMHPQRHYQSTAKPRDEARHLGFSSMVPQTEPPKPRQSIFALQDTPTRTRDSKPSVNMPDHQLSFRRANSLELSPMAKSLLHEKREEAARVREQMVANGEMSHLTNGAARKVAVPRGMSGRFGQAHTQAFEKMDSIAGHPSAFRMDPNRKKQLPSTSVKAEQQAIGASSLKELKRKQSRAELDSPVQYPTLPAMDAFAKPAASTMNINSAVTNIDSYDVATLDTSSSPAKRMKVAANADTSSSRRSPSDHARPLYATPRKIPTSARPNRLIPPSSISRLTSMSARSSSVQRSRLPGLTPIRSLVSKLPADVSTESKPATPLLARSPAKLSVTTKPEAIFGSPTRVTSTLLSRSPSKFGFGDKTTEAGEFNNDAQAFAQPLLSKSPTRALTGSIFGAVAALAQEDKEAPLLSRSAVKAPFVKMSASTENATSSDDSANPLLLRSPSKQVPVDRSGSTMVPTTVSSSTPNLLDRLQLLRKSPVKSILRSPQRLYSDDPSKIAAGTHLATPPRFNASKIASAKARTVSTPLATQKRVDFTSSTKAREKDASKTPERELSAAPSPSPSRILNVPASPERAEMPYPDLALTLSPSPQKRRQTATPRDFTFTAGDAIVFASPRASASPQRAATIRHVSPSAMSLINNLPAPPLTGSKKRKLDFESSFPAGTASVEDVDNTSDKENALAASRSDSATEEDRPAKRMKPSAPTPSPARVRATASAQKPPPMARRPTLGVKPKKGTPAADAAKKRAMAPTSKSTLNSTAKSIPAAVKSDGTKPSTISRDRLNALSQPKART
jgi:hypothetical protein